MKTPLHALALLGLMLSLPAMAQQPPRIWIPLEENLQPVVLDEVAVRITMRGFLAHTRIEMNFTNPNARVLEGEFVFPLGAGQSISGYALEVDGAMRQGVVVPKQTARVAFEDISRQQIDPGLAELTRGNVFRTRLYPIPARGSKRVALEFEQVMDDAGDHWRYLLPLQFREPVRRFSVTAEAPLDAPAPELGGDSPDVGLHFERAASVWRAELARENYAPQHELAFRVPRRPSDANVLEARDPMEPAQRALLARIDSGRPATLPAPAAPRRVALFFDASGSAHDRDLAREREALAAWLATLGEVEVELVAFRDAADSARNFRIRNGDASKLRATLQALPLDGASNYGAIDFKAVRADLAIVIGDGLDTFGRGHIDFSGAPQRLFALHAAQRADHARLADIARRGSAEVLDLTRISATQAGTALSSASWRLLSLSANGTCHGALPTTPQPVGAVFTLAANCHAGTTLRLVFGSDAGGPQIERELVVGAAEATAGELIDAVWRAVAQAQITQMQAAAQPDEAAITQLALRHGVVTAQTSLLVLERIEDYVRYGIAPKETTLREQYERLSAAQPKPATDIGLDDRIAALASKWREFRAWHGQRHAWLETLLLPSAQAEASVWHSLPASADLPQKELAQARADIDAIVHDSRALAERWQRDGAEAASRSTWERDAMALMLRLDAWRERRLALPFADALYTGTGSGVIAESADSVSPASIAPPPPSPAAPAPGQQARASATDISEAALERVTVTGSRIVEDSNHAAAPAMQTSISLDGWNPDTPYLKTLRAAKDPYAAYLTLRKEHATTPSFFLDAADFFRDENKNPALALRVLSNLLEIGDDNTALVRVFGYRLLQWDQPEAALRAFEDARRQRPEEPQSHRDLALALSRLPQPQTARAVELLWHVATHDWHGRFPDIELIALHELTALLAAQPDAEIAGFGIPSELLAPVENGLRVVLTWDADNTDIDLWVIDPAGEAVYYSQPRSRSGGRISKDFTQGYGPEVFTIARPLPGTYRVQAHYFGDRRQSLTGPVTVQLEFQTGFGSGEPARQATTRRLETGKQRIEVGRFRVAP
ncbi:MAG: VIT domain-containing protein [Lysobacteraceae bacterium]